MATRKFIVHLETNWCGESRDFSAIAEEESDIWEFAEMQARENFDMYDGSTKVLEDLFDELEDGEDYTPEQLEEAAWEEPNFYSYVIEEFNGTDEEWEDYDLEYDCTKDNL